MWDDIDNYGLTPESIDRLIEQNYIWADDIDEDERLERMIELELEEQY